jgi:hypothetical protein
MAEKQRLGELLVEQRLVSQETIAQALQVQEGGGQRLGAILVKMQAISADQLAETLAGHLETTICTVAERFSPAVRHILPRYLCTRYGVIPLAEKANNLLELAMANPADSEARNDLEQYTGKVIEACLARYSDIEREIPKRIHLTVKDIFAPRTNILLTRIGVVTCLVLVALLGGFTYQYIHNSLYGTASVTAESTIFKNHDLMVGVEKGGKISLVGRGAYAGGYYAASFNDLEVLKAFIASRQADLSEKQLKWLDWVISKKLPEGAANS